MIPNARLHYYLFSQDAIIRVTTLLHKYHREASGVHDSIIICSRRIQSKFKNIMVKLQECTTALLFDLTGYYRRLQKDHREASGVHDCIIICSRRILQVTSQIS